MLLWRFFSRFCRDKRAKQREKKQKQNKKNHNTIHLEYMLMLEKKFLVLFSNFTETANWEPKVKWLKQGHI